LKKCEKNKYCLRDATLGQTTRGMGFFTLQKVTSQLLNKFKEGSRGSKVGSNNLPQFYICNNKANPCLSLSDLVEWVIVECMNEQIMKIMKKIISSSKYLALFCDEVTIIDNQS
jgi:hypothetical protein